MIGLFNFLLWRVLQQKIASSRLAMRRWSLIWSTICYNAETDKPGRRVPERLLKEQQWCLWYTALRWFAILRELPATVELASCLTNAQSLPAHRPAADDNSLIGCTSHELTNDWSLASTHFVQHDWSLASTHFGASFGVCYYQTSFYDHNVPFDNTTPIIW